MADIRHGCLRPSSVLCPLDSRVHSRSLGSLGSVLIAPLSTWGARDSLANWDGQGGCLLPHSTRWAPDWLGERQRQKSEAVDEELVGTRVREGCHRCPITIVGPGLIASPSARRRWGESQAADTRLGLCGLGGTLPPR